MVSFGIEKTIDVLDFVLNIQKNTTDNKGKLKIILEKSLEAQFGLKAKDVLSYRYKNNNDINDYKAIYYYMLHKFCNYDTSELLKLFELKISQRGIIYTKMKIIQNAIYLKENKKIEQKIYTDFIKIKENACKIKEKLKI